MYLDSGYSALRLHFLCYFSHFYRIVRLNMGKKAPKIPMLTSRRLRKSTGDSAGRLKCRCVFTPSQAEGNQKTLKD